MNKETNKLSREAVETFKSVFLHGGANPREITSKLGTLNEYGVLADDEYGAIMLADWRKLDATPSERFRTRDEIEELESKEDELDCVRCELVGVRKRLIRVVTRELERLGRSWRVPREEWLGVHIFNEETCDEDCYEAARFYLFNGNVMVQFVNSDIMDDADFGKECTEHDLLTVAETLIGA